MGFNMNIYFKKIIKIVCLIVKGVFAIIGLYLGYWIFIGIINFNGYCKSEGKFISNLYTEQEIIDKAIKYVIDNIEQPGVVYDLSKGRDVIFGEEFYENTQIIPYNSIAEFKKINPNCCKITTIDDGDTLNIFMRITGSGYRFIDMKYLRRYRQDKYPYPSINYERVFAFDNCAKEFFYYYPTEYWR